MKKYLLLLALSANPLFGYAEERGSVLVFPTAEACMNPLCGETVEGPFAK